MGNTFYVFKGKKDPGTQVVVSIAVAAGFVLLLFVGVPLLIVGGAIAAGVVFVFIALFRNRSPLDITQQDAEGDALYERVSRRFAEWDKEGPGRIFQAVSDRIVIPYDTPMAEIVAALVAEEDYLFRLEKPDWKALPLAEAVYVRNTLREQEKFLANHAQHEEELVEALVELLRPCVAPWEPTWDDLFTAPYYALLPNPRATLIHIFETVAEYERIGLFRTVAATIARNTLAFSGIDPDVETSRQPIPFARSGLSVQAGIETYLRDTPFYDALLKPTTIGVSRETFFGHMHVIGGTGAGKTQFLSALILHHIQSYQTGVVVVDSQGDLINKLSRLSDEPWRRLLVSPRELQALSINVFDLKRLSSYDEAAREQVVAGAIETLDYLFSGIVGADLTAKQSVFFRFISRLLITLPQSMGRNATLLDMLALLDDITPYLPAVAALPPIQRNFFERDFQSKTFQQTKEQVRYRLNAIFENPTLQRLFTAEQTKLDLFSELNRGSVILIDTAKDYLKGASPHFGRILIALVLQAVLERASQPEDERTPAFLVIDEAAEYFDQNIDDLLTQVRKYKLGCVFAHQYLDQCSSGLRASLAANTAIKMASGVSMADARALAPDLRTSADFILSQPKLRFATYIRGVTSEAVSIPVDAGRLDRQEMMSEEAYAAFLRDNRARVTHTPPAALPPPASVPTAAILPSQDTIDTTPARKW